MVGCDENASRCLRSCSCSYTSIAFSEILTDTEAPLTSKSGQKSFRRSTITSLKCTCPHPPRAFPRPPTPAALPLFPAFSDVREGPLKLRTCLPLPLPATPHAVRRSASHISLQREPDYLCLERTLVSTYGGKPFVPQEPQKLYYVRCSQKYVGVVYNAQYDHSDQMRRNQKHMAEWITPRDPNLTAFQSVVYAKGKKKGEYVSLIGEMSYEKMPMVSVPPTLTVLAQVDPTEVSVSPTPLPPIHYVPEGMANRPPGSSLLRSASNQCSTLYRALGSTGSSSASSLPPSQSSQWEASSWCSEGTDDRMARLWKEIYEDRSECNGTTEGTRRSHSTTRRSTPATSWETSLSENNIFRSGTYGSMTTTKSSRVSIEANPMVEESKEWEKEIQRLDRFLKAKKSISQLSCSTAASFRHCKRHTRPTRRAPSTSVTSTSTVFTEEVGKLGSNMRQLVVAGATTVAAWAKNAFSKNK